jgi:hypothetical protein
MIVITYYLLGANIIQPVKSDPGKCRLMMITQVDPGGIAPPVVVNHVLYYTPILTIDIIITESLC